MKKQILRVYITLTFILLSGSLSLLAQMTQPLHVGDDLSDAQLNNIQNYSSSTARISDFKGKLVLLDFWSTGCSSCIAAFPKMRGLQAQFKGAFQVVLVNPFEDEEKIKVRTADKRFPWFRNFQIPELPSVVGDTLWRVRFPTRTVPHHVWVGPDGHILAITNGHNATPEVVTALLDSMPIKLNLKSTWTYDLREHTVRQAFAGHVRPVGAYSVAGSYFGGEGASSYGSLSWHPYVDSAAGTIRFSVVNEDWLTVVKNLNRLAQYTDSNRQEFVKDAMVFWNVSCPQWFLDPYPNNAMRDDWARRNAICFETIVPLAQKEKLAELVLADLSVYLQETYGIHVSIAKKNVKCKVLKVADSRLIPYSTGLNTYGEVDTLGYPCYRYYNYSFLSIRQALSSIYGIMYWDKTRLSPFRPAIFIDETGLNDNDTLKMVLPYPVHYPVDGTPYLQSMNKILDLYGFALKDEKRDLEVIEINED